MKQIIPFKKDLLFKTKVSEITSISLEREISAPGDGIVSGLKVRSRSESESEQGHSCMT